MSGDDQVPSGGHAHSERIARAEGVVGHQLERDLSGYFELAKDLTEFGTDLIERIDGAAGEPRAIHVGAIILARILTELQACVHLVRLGYVAQAITLVATMVELMHVLVYIAADEVRAEEWLAWANPKKAYPGLGLSQMFTSVARELGLEADAVRREYETVYREASIVKHGNSLGMGETNVLATDDAVLVMVGPVPSSQFLWLGQAAMQWSTRYALLGALAFSQSHILDAERAVVHAKSVELSERHENLSADSKARSPSE